MRKRIDPVGERVGRLVVVAEVESVHSGGRVYRCFRCHCDCGNEALVWLESLRSRRPTESCGCLRLERAAAGQQGRKRRHDQSETPEYRAWTAMKQRCLNPRAAVYPLYGGRGITACEAWAGKHGFENFLAAMGPRPSPRHTLERIDNDGPYSPENCRWATRQEQSRNTRRNRLLTFQGQTHCLVKWAEILGIEENTLYSRIGTHGWSVERAFMTPVGPPRRP